MSEQDVNRWMASVEAAMTGRGVAVSRQPSYLTIGYPKSAGALVVLRRAALVSLEGGMWVATVEPDGGQIFSKEHFTSLNALIDMLTTRYPLQ
jgi:hypothetical protein